ncbi:Uncharacterised protein [Serratia liquefaciens]|uniref:ead/Ea22-like family protein n=1 Tax=Serratia liquefaciens TaxID=614 RepID=UPI002179F5A4|nr:ead/Ea22-like family protein [Serratia liquefaciens]CAI1543270.1 Uncharacterised protein [Serratia liquefaciens]
MDKFSELKDALEFLETTEFDGEWDSALVGGENGKNYHAVINANDVVVRAADDSRNTSWLCDYLEAVSPVKIRALLAELEESKKYAKERDDENESLALTVGRLRVELHNEGAANAHAYERIRGLEKQLATPVRLPGNLPDEGYSVDAMCNWARNERVEMCAKAIRAAGFKCVGDE